MTGVQTCALPIFVIGEEEYAVEVLLVQEIIRYSRPTRIPNSPPVIKGVINFRGKVIPVIDMRAKFGLAGRNYDSFTVIIVLEVNRKVMGMIVDSVSDVISFAPEDIQEADEELINDTKIQHIKGLGKLNGDRLVQILVAEKVLSKSEITGLQKATQQTTGDLGIPVDHDTAGHGEREKSE